MDPQWRETCGNNARAYAEQTFRIDKIHARFMQAFAFAQHGKEVPFESAFGKTQAPRLAVAQSDSIETQY